MKYHISFDIDFKKNPYIGGYIAFEGVDGSGKSTQVELVRLALEKSGKKTITTSEPRSDSEIGKLIHDVLQGKVKTPPEALQYLYTADRVVNHKETVEPSLRKGLTVISHRSFWSVVPYGVMDVGKARYDKDQAQVLHVAQGLLSMYHQFVVPDITFYLRVPVAAAIERLAKMDKVKEMYEKKEKLQQIAKGYEWQLGQFPQMFYVIDGGQDEEKVTADILKRIQNFKK